MPDMTNLPGVYPALQDGNLAVTETTDAPSVLIIGTAEDGPSERLYRVTKPELALATFGRGGTLARGIQEAAEANSNNIFAWRIGATAAKVEWIGSAAHEVGKGITIETVQKDNTIGDEFTVSWDDVTLRLIVWDNDGDKVYDNDSEAPIDTGDVVVSGEADGGEGVSFGTLYTGIVMSALDDISGANIVYTAGTDGVNPTRQGLFEALQDAYRALEGVRADFIVPMNVYLDDKNIADDATLSGSGDNFLGWFKETEQDDGSWLYEWSEAGVKPAGYHEVNFAYQLANFCYQQTKNEWQCSGVIGVLPPASHAVKDVATWIGKAPTFNDDGSVDENGTGLLGNKFMAGAVGQLAGFIATTSEFLDGTAVEDELGNEVDIGAYLDVVSQWINHFNDFDTTGTGYTSTFAPDYAGLMSTLDSKSAPTNKVLSKLVQLRDKLPKTKLDALAGAGYICLQAKDRGVVVVDAPTAARSTSDYKRRTTVRIVFDVIGLVREIGEPYIGNAQDAAVRENLKATLERRLGEMKKLGYLRSAPVNVYATAEDQVQGFCTVEVKLTPAFELRRIPLVISLSR